MIERKVTHHSAPSASATGAVMNCTGLVGALVQITGTFVAIVTFQGTIDGSNWVAIRTENVNTGVVATTATVAGMYYVPFAGIRRFRANLARTSGDDIMVTSIGVGSPPSHPFAAEDFSFGPPTAGDVFYVHGGSGSNSNDGRTPATPWLTMKQALGECTDDAGDIIYVLDYYQPVSETWPISVNKSLVQIIGFQNVYGEAFGGPTAWNVVLASGGKAAFDVVANNVLISGFQIYAGTAGQACITMDDGASVVRIDQCRFCRGTYGVHLVSEDAGYGIEITNSHFIQSLTTGGIYINDDPAFTRIVGNYFDRIDGVAIDIESGAGAIIEHNRIAMGAATNGYAITLGSGVARAFVNLNYAAYGTESGSVYPYTDEGTVTTNNWGRNFYGANAVAPN